MENKNQRREIKTGYSEHTTGTRTKRARPHKDKVLRPRPRAEEESDGLKEELRILSDMISKEQCFLLLS